MSPYSTAVTSSQSELAGRGRPGARAARAVPPLRPDRHAVRARSQAHPPSTPGQLELGRLLVDGAAGARACGRRARRQRLRDGDAARERRRDRGAAIGLIAHVDTTPRRARRRRRAARPPRLRRRRDRAAAAAARGSTRRRCRSSRQASATTSSPASGDTLLGADDKAGVAEIMAAVAYLAAHPELPRPTLRSRSRPTRRSARARRCSTSSASAPACAYTLDGSELGELQDETFSAVEVIVTVTRRRRAPGLGDGQARQRAAARGADRRGAAVRRRSRPRPPRAVRASSTRTS